MNSQRVIIVHLRRANPRKHLSTSSQGEIKLRPESLGRALPLQDFSQGGLGRGLCQRRVRRLVTRIIFLVNKYFSIRPFFSKLTLNSTTMQLSFIKDFKEKSFSFNNIFYHQVKIVCPITNMLTHQILQVQESNLSSKKLHTRLTYRKFNQLIFFFSTNVNSPLVCLKC